MKYGQAIFTKIEVFSYYEFGIQSKFARPAFIFGNDGSRTGGQIQDFKTHNRKLFEQARLDSACWLCLPHGECAGRFGRMAGYGARWKKVPGKFRGSGIAFVHKKTVFSFARSEKRNKDTRFRGLQSPSRVLMERLRIFKENSANSAYYCDKTLQSNINIKKRLNFAKIQHSCEYYEFSMIKIFND